jgi:UDP-N-acetylglucosamine transferase subunit ALG13
LQVFTPLFRNINMHQKRPVCVLLAPLDWGLGHATRCIPIINTLIAQGARVLVAASGPQRELLETEFPGLEFFNIPGYEIRYKRGFLLKWGLIFSFPSILRRIRREHAWLEQLLTDHPVDLVISDNRYGLYHKKPVCVFITHQLFIQSGTGFLKNTESLPGAERKNGSWIDRKILRWNYSFISKFQECWVPDQAGIFSLAGILSHPPEPAPLPVKYIGILSRFKPNQISIEKNTLLILLSGPEPQRTQLERIICAQLSGTSFKTVVVRGLPGTDRPPPVIDGVRIFNHLPSDKLNDIIQSSEFIIARSGYSTIMDLVKMKRNAILIPTPGQTEQEYLGHYLHSKEWMFTVSQNGFSLGKVLQDFQQRKLKMPEIQDALLEAAIQDVLTRVKSII